MNESDDIPLSRVVDQPVAWAPGKRARAVRDDLGRVTGPVVYDAAEEVDMSESDDRVARPATPPEDAVTAGLCTTSGCTRDLRAQAEDVHCCDAYWRPIETAPRDGTRALVWDRYSRCARLAALDVSVFIASGRYTHWQPLPEPPRGES